MINPRPQDVLANLIATLDEKVLPRLTETDLLSAVTTTKHLIRYVLNQLVHEHQSFSQELPKLIDLLHQAQAFLADAGDAPELLARVETALAGPADIRDLSDIEALAARIQTLREGLHAALGHLIEHRAAYATQPAYDPLRTAIRDYLAWQNSEEAKIIAPTYYGQGPRR